MIGSEIGELYPILPKIFYRFNANPINIPMYFFFKIENADTQIYKTERDLKQAKEDLKN